MQGAKRKSTHLQKRQLENQFSDLMQQRKQIQGYSSKTMVIKQGFQNTQSNPFYQTNVRQPSKLTQHQQSVISKFEKNIMSKIQEEREENQEIKERISDLQIRSEEERRRSTLLQTQLHKLTGVNYSKPNIKNPPKTTTHQSNTIPISRPISPIPTTSNSQNIIDIKREIQYLVKQNNQLKSQGNNANIIAQIKSRIYAAEKRAEEYIRLINIYKERLSSKSQGNPQISTLLTDAEHIRGKGLDLINQKENIGIRNNSDRHNTKKRITENELDRRKNYVQPIPQQRNEYAYEEKYPRKQYKQSEYTPPTYNSNPRTSYKNYLKDQQMFPNKLQVKSVISSIQQIKRQQSGFGNKKPQIRPIQESSNLGSPVKVTESKKHIQSMLDEMMKVFTGSE